MTEKEARIKLESMLQLNHGTEAVANMTDLIELHIKEIYSKGQGVWVERIAQKHILISLEASLRGQSELI